MKLPKKFSYVPNRQFWPDVDLTLLHLSICCMDLFIKCCIMIGGNNFKKVTFVKYPTKFVFLASLVNSAWLAPSFYQEFAQRISFKHYSMLEDNKYIKITLKKFPKKSSIEPTGQFWRSCDPKLYKFLSQDWSQGFF